MMRSRYIFSILLLASIVLLFCGFSGQERDGASPVNGPTKTAEMKSVPYEEAFTITNWKNSNQSPQLDAFLTDSPLSTFVETPILSAQLDPFTQDTIEIQIAGKKATVKVKDKTITAPFDPRLKQIIIKPSDKNQNHLLIQLAAGNESIQSILETLNSHVGHTTIQSNFNSSGKLTTKIEKTATTQVVEKYTYIRQAQKTNLAYLTKENVSEKSKSITAFDIQGKPLYSIEETIDDFGQYQARSVTRGREKWIVLGEPDVTSQEKNDQLFLPNQKIMIGQKKGDADFLSKLIDGKRMFVLRLRSEKKTYDIPYPDITEIKLNNIEYSLRINAEGQLFFDKKIATEPEVSGL